VVLHIDDVEISDGVEADFVGLIQTGLQCRSTISRVTFGSIANDGFYRPIGSDPAYPLTGIFAQPDRSVRTSYDSERIIQLGIDRRPTIPLKPRLASPCQILDLPNKI
jgi:hypothetical protein